MQNYLGIPHVDAWHSRLRMPCMFAMLRETKRTIRVFDHMISGWDTWFMGLVLHWAHALLFLEQQLPISIGTLQDPEHILLGSLRRPEVGHDPCFERKWEISHKDNDLGLWTEFHLHTHLCHGSHIPRIASKGESPQRRVFLAGYYWRQGFIGSTNSEHLDEIKITSHRHDALSDSNQNGHFGTV